MSDSKACSRCKQILPTTDFGKHSTTKDGLYSQCQPCRRQARAEYRIRQADAIKLQQADNYQRNREKRIAYANKRVYENLERFKKYQQISKRRNKEAIAANTRRRNARKRNNGIFTIRKHELKQLAQTPCFYCGNIKNLTVDHIVPISRGGRDSIGNLVSACKSCNSSKGALTIMEWRKKRETPQPTH